jgi:hypothetical protein
MLKILAGILIKLAMYVIRLCGIKRQAQKYSAAIAACHNKQACKAQEQTRLKAYTTEP